MFYVRVTKFDSTMTKGLKQQGSSIPEAPEAWQVCCAEIPPASEEWRLQIALGITSAETVEFKVMGKMH